MKLVYLSLSFFVLTVLNRLPLFETHFHFNDKKQAHAALLLFQLTCTNRRATRIVRQFWTQHEMVRRGLPVYMHTKCVKTTRTHDRYLEPMPIRSIMSFKQALE